MSSLTRRPARRLGTATALALVAGLATAVPSSAAAECQAAPAPANNNSVNAAPTPTNDTATVLGGTSTTIDVLGNDTDPDTDTLAVVNASQPNRGATCLLPNGKIQFFAEAAQTGYTQTFRYGVTDGDRYRTAQVTVTVNPLEAATAQLRKKLVLRKNGSVKRKAVVVFTNPNPAPLVVVAGPARADDFTISRTIGAGRSVAVTTRARQLQFLAVVESDESVTFVNVGVLNTRTGKVRSEYIGESMGSDFSRSTRAAWARYAR